MRTIAQHRTRYVMADKAEWWWIMDDTLEAVAAMLNEVHFAVLDQFLLPSQMEAVRDEVKAARDTGKLKPGVLGGGRLGSTLAYGTSPPERLHVCAVLVLHASHFCVQCTSACGATS